MADIIRDAITKAHNQSQRVVAERSLWLCGVRSLGVGCVRDAAPNLNSAQSMAHVHVGEFRECVFFVRLRCVSFSSCRLFCRNSNTINMHPQHAKHTGYHWSPGKQQRRRRRHEECHVCTHAYAVDDFCLHHMSLFFISSISRLDVKQIEPTTKGVLLNDRVCGAHLSHMEHESLIRSRSQYRTVTWQKRAFPNEKIDTKKRVHR